MLGRKKKQEGGGAASQAGLTGPRVPRHSGAWSVLRKRLETEPGLRILDIGYTSSVNINYLTGLGHSIFMSDLVHEACAGQWQNGQDEEGNPIWDTQAFLAQTLDFSGRLFDIVLLWTALDYLPDAFVQPVVSHLYSSMNPGGQVLALFHTRTQGEETVHCRFHVSAGNEIHVQLSEPFPIRRSFTNRSIERLFAGWSGHKQFLARDSISEVIMTR
ncbi:MAG TPA: methyltransferase domain-containing protein [Terracidiphilus sp.]|nr:methyltransferase domain-containing protein [Terracidiphilus sp.]